MPDDELSRFLKENSISLTLEEVRSLPEKLGRNPTLTELHIFNIQWSEHSSYKSSKKLLKQLPTESPKVILGPKEDSGIVELGTFKGKRYGIVVSHESHNHPSQVVPYEGAATGVGGILRDVLCMGAEVIATGDPLRFGDPFGKNKDRTRYIANAVVDGIASYGNAVGIPVLAGDVYFDACFDDNCLVNVVSLGLVKEEDIIHSYVPKEAAEEEYEVVLVGKATDNSGFGGAAFASLILDEEEAEINKGAVQVPDPFLKNMLIKATRRAFEVIREKKIKVGFKDLGAGGIMCATSELGSAAGFGMELDLDKVHVSMHNLPPYVIACSETQERFAWVVPKSFTQELLKIYNEDYDLPNIAEGAKATVIGKVTREKNYVLFHNGQKVCDAPIDEVTSGVLYDREQKPMEWNEKDPDIPEPVHYKEIILKILRHPTVASKADIYKHYDTEVQGRAVFRPGEADAGVMAPLPDEKVGVALSVDSNPKYGRISPYWGAVNAVFEAMRNVAATGAVPTAITDCLNYGNPEKPEAFWQFAEGVRGISDAARKISYYNTDLPVPVVSGNVSFYNESAAGKAVDPSPVIACIGVMDDFSKARGIQLLREGSYLFLVGERKHELGGSIYYEIHGGTGSSVPKPDFETAKKQIWSVIDAISTGKVLASHDISDGGLAAALAEMAIGPEGKGNLGVEVQLNDDLPTSTVLFSESPGFILEVSPEDAREIEKVFSRHGVDVFKIGEVTSSQKITIKHNEKEVCSIPLEEAKEAWLNGLSEALK
ncbi:phosphoribosylformylglycinamidine synthase subunit PurL [Candidatus Woesearchaeota archaeon]|nr:MAG: phosphoribosylformylglycinamidine synthase subunit PurL [Candidatus Woesearchaeota archaeon]